MAAFVLIDGFTKSGMVVIEGWSLRRKYVSNDEFHRGWSRYGLLHQPKPSALLVNIIRGITGTLILTVVFSFVGGRLNPLEKLAKIRDCGE